MYSFYPQYKHTTHNTQHNFPTPHNTFTSSGQLQDLSEEQAVAVLFRGLQPEGAVIKALKLVNQGAASVTVSPMYVCLSVSLLSVSLLSVCVSMCLYVCVCVCLCVCVCALQSYGAPRFVELIKIYPPVLLNSCHMLVFSQELFCTRCQYSKKKSLKIL
mgnify:CR=1 FL=1